MKFPHDTRFNPQFDAIPDLAWYPYVGQRFGEQERRVMVFAHNAYMDAATYERRRTDFEQKPVWADCVEEYAYEQAWYTQAFRYFVKGAVGLRENYGYESPPEVIAAVDSFLSGIAYLNFIQGLVVSNQALVGGSHEQVQRSKRINLQILQVLGITHCICWGGPVFEYVSGMEGMKQIISERIAKRGFAYRLLENAQGHRFHVLKVHHPSMPNFDCYSEETQSIIAEFLHKPVLADTGYTPALT